jgi:hypothetical protein
MEAQLNLVTGNLTASTNETKHSLDEHNRQWEQTAIELETLEESFWRQKTMH